MFSRTTSHDNQPHPGNRPDEMKATALIESSNLSPITTPSNSASPLNNFPNQARETKHESPSQLYGAVNEFLKVQQRFHIDMGKVADKIAKQKMPNIPEVRDKINYYIEMFKKLSVNIFSKIIIDPLNEEQLITKTEQIITLLISDNFKSLIALLLNASFFHAKLSLLITAMGFDDDEKQELEKYIIQPMQNFLRYKDLLKKIFLEINKVNGSFCKIIEEDEFTITSKTKNNIFSSYFLVRKNNNDGQSYSWKLNYLYQDTPSSLFIESDLQKILTSYENVNVLAPDTETKNNFQYLVQVEISKHHVRNNNNLSSNLLVKLINQIDMLHDNAHKLNDRLKKHEAFCFEQFCDIIKIVIRNIRMEYGDTAFYEKTLENFLTKTLNIFHLKNSNGNETEIHSVASKFYSDFILVYLQSYIENDIEVYMSGSLAIMRRIIVDIDSLCLSKLSNTMGIVFSSESIINANKKSTADRTILSRVEATSTFTQQKLIQYLFDKANFLLRKNEADDEKNHIKYFTKIFQAVLAMGPSAMGIWNSLCKEKFLNLTINKETVLNDFLNSHNVLKINWQKNIDATTPILKKTKNLIALVLQQHIATYIQENWSEAATCLEDKVFSQELERLLTTSKNEKTKKTALSWKLFRITFDSSNIISSDCWDLLEQLYNNTGNIAAEHLCILNRELTDNNAKLTDNKKQFINTIINFFNSGLVVVTQDSSSSSSSPSTSNAEFEEILHAHKHHRDKILALDIKFEKNKGLIAARARTWTSIESNNIVAENFEKKLKQYCVESSQEIELALNDSLIEYQLNPVMYDIYQASDRYLANRTIANKHTHHPKARYLKNLSALCMILDAAGFPQMDIYLLKHVVEMLPKLTYDGSFIKLLCATLRSCLKDNAPSEVINNLPSQDDNNKTGTYTSPIQVQSKSNILLAYLNTQLSSLLQEKCYSFLQFIATFSNPVKYQSEGSTKSHLTLLDPESVDIDVEAILERKIRETTEKWALSLYLYSQNPKFDFKDKIQLVNMMVENTLRTLSDLLKGILTVIQNGSRYNDPKSKTRPHMFQLSLFNALLLSENIVVVEGAEAIQFNEKINCYIQKLNNDNAKKSIRENQIFIYLAKKYLDLYQSYLSKSLLTKSAASSASSSPLLLASAPQLTIAEVPEQKLQAYQLNNQVNKGQHVPSGAQTSKKSTARNYGAFFNFAIPSLETSSALNQLKASLDQEDCLSPLINKTTRVRSHSE